MKNLKYNWKVLCFVLIFVTSIAFAHPFYVSISSITFNPQKKQVEISCRLFYDDLELALKNQMKQRIDVINPKNKQQADSTISQYIRNNFRLKVNGKPVELRYLGYEIIDDVAWCYLYSDQISSINQLEVTNQLLYQDFKRQSNIMHVQVGKTKKSYKLDHPKRVASFSF